MGMLVNCEFSDEYKNISHNVTLVPRLEYSSTLLSNLIIFLKKEKKVVKSSNKIILSKFDEDEIEYKNAIDLERKIIFTLEVLCYIEKRIQSISDLSSIPVKLSPVIPILRIISAQIFEILPVCSHQLCEISVHLGSIILDSGALTQARFDFEKSNEESSRILDEVKLIADSKISKQYPNLDFSKHCST